MKLLRRTPSLEEIDVRDDASLLCESTQRDLTGDHEASHCRSQAAASSKCRDDRASHYTSPRKGEKTTHEAPGHTSHPRRPRGQPWSTGLRPRRERRGSGPLHASAHLLLS